MSRALQQIGHADYRSTNYSGFPTMREDDPEPVGDPDVGYDDDEEARQSSLDALDLNPRHVGVTSFEHKGYTVRVWSAPSRIFTTVYGVTILAPDGTERHIGRKWAILGNVEPDVVAFIDGLGA